MAASSETAQSLKAKGIELYRKEKFLQVRARSHNSAVVACADARFAQAAQLFRQAVAADATDPTLRMNLCAALLEQGACGPAIIRGAFLLDCSLRAPLR
jgi:hypothetical protein